MKSLERELLAWIVGTLLLGSMLVTMTTYVVTLDEMDEVFDSDLRNVATSVAHYHQGNAPHVQAHAPVLVQPHQGDEEADETEIATFAWDNDGRLVYASDARIPMRFDRTEGLSHPVIGGEEWIVYTVAHQGGIVQAAQRRASRREMAGESAAQILPFQFALAVVVAGMLIFSLRRGLRPLDDAARDIAGRSARSLEAIDGSSTPTEIQPVVRAVNSLMAKLGQSFSSQRQFISEAAHELRTPIAALRLQLRLLEKSADEPDREASMAALKLGIARAQRLIEQLLAVARTDPAGGAAPLQPVDLADIVRLVVEPGVIKAEVWEIDLGAEIPGPLNVLGDPEQLVVLLDNLVDNALRFTPAGGVVDVGLELRQGRPTLYVRDTGVGIPREERPRLFTRFTRGRTTHLPGRENPGSGLGLSIVKAIADRHGAVVRLADHPSGEGTEVSVQFPVAAGLDSVIDSVSPDDLS